MVSDDRFCPIKYYRFDRLGYICDPYSVESIEKAVVKAYRDKTVNVDNDYFDFFSYYNAAKITRQAYLRILGNAQ